MSIYDPNNPRPSGSSPYSSSTPNTVTSTSTSATRYPKGPASDFKRGIKRDKAHYDVLKDDAHWDDWKRATLATVANHGCEVVMDPTYQPTNQDELDLFNEIQKFMYDVFITTLKTSMGRHFVRVHESTGDAQAVWKDYSYHMRTSTKADMELEDLLTIITSARLSNSYRGPTIKFITDWLDHIRRYEGLLPVKSRFPNNMKKTILQNAVQEHETFKNVTQIEKYGIAQGQGPLDFDAYTSLIQKVAAQYDRPKYTANRLIKMHRGEYHNNYDSDTDEEPFGSIGVHNVNRRLNRSRRPALPKSVWQSLSREDQLTWDEVSDFAKRAILFAYKDHSTTSPGTIDHTQRTSDAKRQANVTETVEPTVDDDVLKPESEIPESTPISDINDEEEHDLRRLIHKATRQIEPGDIRHVLSSSVSQKDKMKTTRSESHAVNVHETHLNLSINNRALHTATSLIDRGANGGIAGDNVRIITTTDRRVNVSGIDNHQLQDLKIVTAGGVCSSNQGEVIVILHQYAYNPGHQTIHSSMQMEHFGIHVDDRSAVFGGTQTIKTPDSHELPLVFRNGLPYLNIRPFSDTEWETLSHIVLTSDVDWDPAITDRDAPVTQLTTRNTTVNTTSCIDHPFILSEFDPTLTIFRHQISPSNRDYSSFRDHFLNTPVTTIERTFQATTQYARSGWLTGHIFDTHRAPFPALNVCRRNEPVATDTVYADVPAIDNGSLAAQFFCGCETTFCDIYGVHTDGDFARVLMDNIRRRGAMDMLVSDRAQAEISNKVQDILRHLCINDWQSEPHYHHQNAAERRYRWIKHSTNHVLNSTGAPAYCWLLCMEYVCFIHNRLAMENLAWRTPFECLTGPTLDISMIIRFRFWDKIYAKRDESRGGKEFPSSSNEIACRFVGFSESVGHPMTYKILTLDTKQILYRSRIRLSDAEPNLRAEADVTALKDDGPTNDVEKDKQQSIVQSKPRPLAVIDPNDIIGRTYLTQPAEDGTRIRLRITEALEELDKSLNQSDEVVRFRAKSSDGTYEELQTYNQMLDKLEEVDGDDDVWKFRSIDNHQGPLKRSDPDYKGSSWNVRVNWENGEISYEPLSIIGKSDPVTVAIYAKENDLLRLDGWKKFTKLAHRQKKLLRMANQAKLQSFRTAPIYHFGIFVPRNHQHAMELDRVNGNSLWREAELTELDSIDEYGIFRDISNGIKPKGYKKIRYHIVYAVKHDLRRKARLVADGNLTETPLTSVYSSVVSLRGLRLCLFLAEHNGLQAWSTDIGNAYLEAFTDEKVYVVAGDEFGDRAGHCLIVVKALYGLRSSGLRWWERFSVVLHELGFKPSKAENDIWMRPKEGHYEYVARYVDDLAVVSSDPQSIMKLLKEQYSFKLKGTGPIQYHLGANFERDRHGNLCMSPSKYIERMIDSYHRLFGVKPKTIYSSPLEKGDHPELDTSPELDIKDVKIYQSMIGAAQWVVSLGRFDVATAVMTLSSFRATPRQGHLNRIKRVYGYLAKMRHGKLRFRTGLPDYSALPIPEYDWKRTIYGSVKEICPTDAPKPLGKEVLLTSYVDANLCHDFTSGRSVTGVLHLVNQTVIDFYSKKQPLVQTATYGSEYMAARTATEQIIELRTTLQYLGVPIKGASYLFGDNKTVVDSSINPASKLRKRHVLLSFHRVREAIAARILHFVFIPGSINPADILSKAWGYQAVWSMLKPLLFWEGDTLTSDSHQSESSETTGSRKD